VRQRTNSSYKQIFLRVKTCEVRTLRLAAARTRLQAASKAEHAIKLAGSERPSERPVLALSQQSQNGAREIREPGRAVHNRLSFSD